MRLPLPAASSQARSLEPGGRLLVEQLGPHGRWRWLADAWEGCAFGCPGCGLGPLSSRSNAALLLSRELAPQRFEHRWLCIGEQGEPYGEVEERDRLTRGMLEVLVAHLDSVGQLQLEIATRGSAVARDLDLLKVLARRGTLKVTFHLVSTEERVRRVLEPSAPSALRRLVAMEALSRSGINVGVRVGPVPSGADDAVLALEALLTRAANAGARYADLRLLEPLPPAGVPSHLRRLLCRPSSEAEQKARAQAFARHCRHLGLAVAQHPTGAEHAEAQLGLFGPR